MKIQVEDLPTDPEAACIYVIEWFEEQFQQSQRRKFSAALRVAVAGNLKILAIAARRLDYAADLRRPLSKLTENLDDEVVTRIRANIEQIRDVIETHRLDAHFSGKTKYFSDSTFSLEASEVEAILEKTTEMRFIISNSEYFDQPHKKRLLERLSQIEFEVYRDKGRFDAILGGVVDFGEALGKFGKRAKPLVDRMSEVRKITQSKTKSYDELPAPEETKQLPPPDSDGTEGN